MRVYLGAYPRGCVFWSVCMKVCTYIREEVFRFPTFSEHAGNSHQILAQAAYGFRISTFDVDALVRTNLREKSNGRPHRAPVLRSVLRTDKLALHTEFLGFVHKCRKFCGEQPWLLYIYTVVAVAATLNRLHSPPVICSNLSSASHGPHYVKCL